MDFDSQLPVTDSLVNVAGATVRSSRHLTLSVVGSAAAHGGAVLLAYVTYSLFSGPAWHPPSLGINSIELVAIIEGDAEPFVEFTTTASPTKLESKFGETTRRADGDHLVPIVPEAVVAASGLDDKMPNLESGAAGYSPRENRHTALEAVKTEPSQQFVQRKHIKPANVANPVARNQPIDANANSLPSKQQSGAKFDAAPSKQVSPKPEYPAAARAAGHEGRVVLKVKVSAIGRVTRASVHRSSGHRSLDESALRTVMKWRFDPATRDGQPVTCEVAVPFCFDIVRDD
jgi:TonB family protein